LALSGQAAVFVADGRYADGINCLREAVVDPAIFGGCVIPDAELIEALFLAGVSGPRVADALAHLNARHPDPRHNGEDAAARALAVHAMSDCVGECLAKGAHGKDEDRVGQGTRLIGEVKLGVLRVLHGRRREVRLAWGAVSRAVDAGLVHRLRPWLRLYVGHAASAIEAPGGAELLVRLADADPEGWRRSLVEGLPFASGADRKLLLSGISRHADKKTMEAMRGLSGSDVAQVRRLLTQATAARLYLSTFGGVALHRGDWTGPTIPVEKRRVRVLLALLAAHSTTTLTRDMAIDIMWPDAEPEAAVNSLNQTVFQLRRVIDPDYRGGESAEYVVSTAEKVALNPELVRTDLDEIRRLAGRVAGADWTRRNALAKRAIALVRGEFLADLPYEEWTAAQQLRAHDEVRSHLLPLATQPSSYDLDVAVQAASAIVGLDPYDEAAVLALADCLARSGRRVAARDVVVDYARRLKTELEESPSDAVVSAAHAFGSVDQINTQLIVGRF
jgi:DNA-binding SARP family transcriptional activator